MRRDPGFTLIEILIAMAVFLIGMVSILAVFPVGIKSSTLSTDQSVATAVAESLNDALTLALRQYDGSATSNVWFYHDGLGATGSDFFRLPPIETWVSGSTTYTANGYSQPTWYPYKVGTIATSPLTNFNDVTNATVQPAVLASITGSKGGNIGNLVGGAGVQNTRDFQDPLGQYSFRFMCQEYKNPNDGTVSATTDVAERNLPYCGVANLNPSPSGDGDPGGRAFMYQNGAQAQVIDKLYQFTIYVYRGWKPVPTDTVPPFNVYTLTPPSSGAWGPGAVWQDQMKHPNKIERFEFLVYAPGAR